MCSSDLPPPLPCVGAGAVGDGSAATPTARAILSCQSALTKTGGKLASTRIADTESCVTGLLACLSIQEKGGFATPADAVACTARATGNCTRRLAALTNATTHARDAMLRACSPLIPAELRAALGFASLQDACGAFASNADVVDCVIAQSSCRTDQAIALTSPRAAEVLGVAGLLSGFSCLGP